MSLNQQPAESESGWTKGDYAHARVAKMSEGVEPLPMRGKLVLRGAVRLVTPFVLLFGLYVQMHGDFGPGGGFQAGMIFATGFVLFGLIFGIELSEQVFPARWAERFLALGVLIFTGVGVYSLLAPGEFVFLDYDALGSHGQHYGILMIELGVGLTVCAAMVRLFYVFATLSELPAAMEDALDSATPLGDLAACEAAATRVETNEAEQGATR